MTVYEREDKQGENDPAIYYGSAGVPVGKKETRMIPVGAVREPPLPNRPLCQCRRDEHINHHPDNIVRDGDKRSGCQCRIDLQAVERHRDKRTEDTGEHNDGKQAQGDGSRYPFVAQHKEVIYEYDQTDDAGIDQRNNSFL